MFENGSRAYPQLVITVGLDLAATPERTSLALIEWPASGAVVRSLICPVDDDLILEAVGPAEKAGVDCPLGWPDSFVDFVSAHRLDQVRIPKAETGIGWRKELTMRRTDHFVHDRLGLTPLSVSADRIGHVAMRCAVLLAKFAASGEKIDRAGNGKLVEVYPAASLKAWQLSYHRGYKRPRDAARLGLLVEDLRTAAPWLDLGEHEAVLRSSHDAFDSVVAALTARAVVQGLTCPPPAGDLAAAKTEGWIAMPTSPLRQIL